MKQAEQINKNWLNTDRMKLQILIFTVFLSGLFSGVMMFNIVFSLTALSALIVLITRFGYRYAVFACLGSSFISLVLYDLATMTVLLLIVTVPGFIMGYKSRIFSAPLSILMWGMFPFLIPFAYIIIFYPELTSQTSLIVNEMQNMLVENTKQFNLNDSQLQMLSSSLATSIEWTIRLIPGIFLTLFMGIILFAYLGAAAVGSYFGTILPQFKPLYLWKLDEFWLIPLGLSLLFVLLDSFMLKTVGENALVFLVHLYAFFGICSVDYYLKKLNIPIALRIIIYLLVLVIIVFIIPVLAVLGVVDSRFDFRKVASSAK